jgi:hypothetical protein
VADAACPLLCACAACCDACAVLSDSSGRKAAAGRRVQPSVHQSVPCLTLPRHATPAADADDEGDEEEEGDDDEVADDEEEDEPAQAPPKKMKKVKREDWEKLNDNKAIWLRKSSDVTKEEYEKFYTAISKVGWQCWGS